jgi:threonine/homoserine/homoserine lactone efflux protein
MAGAFGDQVITGAIVAIARAGIELSPERGSIFFGAIVQAHNYWIFALALSVAVATPGPGIFAVTSCAIGRGFREAVALTCGVVIGDWIFFLLAAIGMTALARSMGDLFLIVKFAGAAYLIWLGVKLWRARVDMAPGDDTSARRRRGFGRNVVAGMTLTLGNPKTIAFYAGLLPTFIDLKKLTPADIATMMLIMLPIVFGIPTAYAYAAAKARRFLTSPRRMRAMNRTAGTIMIGAGVTVAVR